MEMVKASSVPGGGDGDSQTKWSDIAIRLPGRLGEQVKARWSNELDPGGIDQDRDGSSK